MIVSQQHPQESFNRIPPYLRYRNNPTTQHQQILGADSFVSLGPGALCAGNERGLLMPMVRCWLAQVIEERVPLEDVLEADEVFCTGTAVVVVPVGSITYKGDK